MSPDSQFSTTPRCCSIMIESFYPYYKTNTFELPLSAYKTGFLYKHDEAAIVLLAGVCGGSSLQMFGWWESKRLGDGCKKHKQGYAEPFT